MRWLWPLLVVGAVLLLPGVRGDPAITSPGAGQGLATWSFSNPASYTAVNATIGASGATLAWTVSSATDTSEADFTAALARTNVNLTAAPGDVRIDNTAEAGQMVNATWQPGPSVLSDNILNNGNGGKVNFGTSTELIGGNWGGGAWFRSILQFPTLPLPANATLVNAKLQLYFYDPIVPDMMYFSAHRVLDSWSEYESTWNSRNATLPWTTAGGDFDPTALDTSSPVGTTPGWFTWNITSLAVGWWTRTIENDGLMIRQVGDTTSSLGNKGFYSADATNATARPRLLLSYTLPSSKGHLESRIMDAGSRAAWGRIWWNATLPAGTTVSVRTRSGDVLPVDASWSPWSSVASAPGALIASPSARYLEYSLDLVTTNTGSPAVHDVSVGWGRYAPDGRVDTLDFAPASLANWGMLSLNATFPAETSASLQYSQDGGGSWTSAGLLANLSSALAQRIRIRLVLTTTLTTASATVHGITLAYTTSSGSVGPPAPSPGPGAVNPELPWAVVLLVLGSIAIFLVAVRRHAAGFRPTGLFLIHADGRLIARVGTDEMQDELAASAVFTLVLRFVQDSFRGPGGTGGELRSFQVDEREVSIVRGRFLCLALVSRGPRPAWLPARMSGFVADLEAGHAALLERWDGLRTGTGGVEVELAAFFRGGYKRRRPARARSYRA